MGIRRPQWYVMITPFCVSNSTVRALLTHKLGFVKRADSLRNSPCVGHGDHKASFIVVPILSFRSGRGTASHQCFERVFRNGFQRKNQLTEEIARRHKNKASLSLVYLALHSAKLMWPKLDEPNNAMLRAECYTGTLRFLGASNEAVFEGLLHLQDNSAIAVFRQLLFDGQSDSMRMIG